VKAPYRRSLGAIVLPLVLAACGRAEAPPAPPLPEVTVAEVEPRTVPLSYELPGRLEGSREVEVHARVSGILLRRSYVEGRPVARGATLFVIDPAPFEADVLAAEAHLAEQRARLAWSERDFARLAPLLAERVASQRDYDEALAALEQARALVLSAEARLSRARLDLDYTQVEAPIAGLSGRALHSEGSLVGPGDDSLLTRIVQVRPIWVRFAMADQEFFELRRRTARRRVEASPAEGLDVELVFADGTLHDERGRVNFADPLVDSQTGSVDLRAEIPNAAGSLMPGQFVRVRLLGIERPQAILVPQRAVQQGERGKFVFVLDAEGRAQLRPVEVGEWIGDDWLIESGLEGGERVIVDGVVRVRPGAAVEVVPAAGTEP
jgi:membrane fusion protein (multidrug efflux system)